MYPNVIEYAKGALKRENQNLSIPYLDHKESFNNILWTHLFLSRYEVYLCNTLMRNSFKSQ